MLRSDTGSSLMITDGATLTLSGVYESTAGTRCTFVVAAGCTMKLLDLAGGHPWYITGDKDQVLLDLSGTLEASKVMIGKQGQLLVKPGSRLDIDDLYLQESVVASVTSGSIIGAGSGSFDLKLLSIGPKSSLEFDVEEVNIKVTEMVMKWGSELTTTSTLKYIDIKATDSVTLHDGGVVNVGGGATSVELAAVLEMVAPTMVVKVALTMLAAFTDRTVNQQTMAVVLALHVVEVESRLKQMRST